MTEQPHSPTAPGAMILSKSPGFWWIAAVFLVSLCVYAVFSHRVMVYTDPPTGDQPFYLMTAISIIRDGDIEESNNYAAQQEELFYPYSFTGNFQGILAPLPLPPHAGKTTARPEEEIYSKHGLGLSMMIVPGWLWGEWNKSGLPLIDVPAPVPFLNLRELRIAHAGWPSVVYELNILGALLAVQVFLLAWETTRNRPIALAVALAMVFSNPQMSFSYLIFPEMPAGLCAIYAFRRLAMGLQANGPLRFLLIGLCIGFLPWLHTRYLPITLALMALAFIQWLQIRRQKPAATSTRSTRPLPETAEGTEPLPAPVPAKLPRRSYTGGLILTLVPVVVAGLLLMGYYQWLYGLPLPNTQDHAGFINPLDDALGIPLSILGLLLDQQWGLLVFAPVYTLAFVGLVAMWRDPERRRLFVWLLIMIVPYYLFVAAYRQWWGEWCPPARYLATITPLLAIPLAESLRVLRNNALYKTLFFGLAAVGWFFMGSMLAYPRGLFNHPSGQAEVFLWLREQFDLNLVPLFPAVVKWAFWHGYGLNWVLLLVWTFIALAIVIFGVMALPNRIKPQEQQSA